MCVCIYVPKLESKRAEIRDWSNVYFDIRYRKNKIGVDDGSFRDWSHVNRPQISESKIIDECLWKIIVQGVVPHLRLQKIPRISRLFLGKPSSASRKWPLQLSVSTNHECSREKIIVTYSFQSILLLYIKCKALHLARFCTTFKGYLNYRRLWSLQSKMSIGYETGTLT